jgi:TolA-binding protein
LARVDLAAFEQDKPMKTKWLAGCILLAGAMILRAQTNDLSAALQKGLFEEEANRNLDAAISNYQALATQFDRDRQVAATAIFRLGECYRKLGRTNNAVVQYERIVREFPDQKTLATLSQQNLTGLGTTP